MSEDTNYNQDSEQPFLILKGRVTVDERIRAYRWSALRIIAIRILIFIAVVFVMSIGINLYYSLPPFYSQSSFTRASFWIMLGIVILVYGVELMWLRPRKLRKNLRELYGDDSSWETEYDFYEEHFTIRLFGTKNSPDVKLNYADLKKLKVYRYYILLQTKTKNRLSITRDELSWEDEQKLLETLRERSGIE